MVTFLCGVPCAGKTTYREKHFAEIPYVDIYDFQKVLEKRTYENLVQTHYQTFEKALELSLKGDVIVEDTALKSFRRAEAVKFLRDGGYEGEIHLIFLVPSRAEFLGRALNRYTNPEYTGELIEDFVDLHLASMELPTADEGFDTITVIEQ